MPVVRSEPERKSFQRQLKRKVVAAKRKAAEDAKVDPSEVAAATRIQALVRGMQTRFWVACWDYDARVIQNAFRKMVARREKRKRERIALQASALYYIVD